MEKSTFEYLWREGIVKAAKNVYSEIADGNKYSVSIDISGAMRDQVYQEYETIRKMVRRKYFDVGVHHENLIDGHKICACMTRALMNVRIIRYEKQEAEIPSQIIFANYAVAFTASIYILYLFLLSDYMREGELDCYNRLLERHAFVFPETNVGHDSYVIGRIKALALNDTYGNDFDFLAYADMLFWIEKYNKDFICSHG